MAVGARTGAAVAILIVAAGSGAAWWLARERGDAAAAAPTPPEATAAPADAQLERAHVSAAEVVQAAATDGRSAVDAPAPEPVAVAQEAVATVRVLVRAKEDRSPLANVRMFFASVDGSGSATNVYGSRGKRREAPVTDADGRAELEIDPDTPGQMKLINEGDAWSQHAVPPVPAGSSIELVVDLPTRPDAQLHGQLVDAETEAGLAGEINWVHGGAGQASVRTDALGRFEIAVASWNVGWLKATAAGHAWATFPASADFGDPASPLVLRLARLASLDVTVRDPTGAAIEGAHVELVTDGSRLQQGSAGILDFYFGEDPVWRATTGSDGRATIADAPPRVPLQFAVDAPLWSRRAEPEPLTLEPGEIRALHVTLGSGATVAGKLEDANGEPIRDRTIWRAVATYPAPMMFRTYQDHVADEATDAEGRFEFPSVPLGSWWIGPAPEDDGVPPIAQVVEVAQESGRIEIVLRTELGLYVRGRVFDPLGTPAKGCWVSGTELGGLSNANAEADDEGAFELGPLPRGRWMIRASDFDEYVDSEPLEVEAGQEGVLLTLRIGGSLVGEVVDAETGQRQPCEVCVVRSNSNDFGSRTTSVEDGTFSLRGFASGAYSLVARTRDGKVGALTDLDVVTGRSLDGVRIAVSKGARVMLSYTGKSDAAIVNLLIGGARIDCRVVSRAEIEVVDVPAAEVELKWREDEEGEEFRTEKMTLTVGEQRKVVLGSGG